MRDTSDVILRTNGVPKILGKTAQCDKYLIFRTFRMYDKQSSLFRMEFCLRFFFGTKGL